MSEPGLPMKPSAPHTLADKINFLFENIPRSDGSRHSNDEVAAAMPDKISGSYIWLLRRGERDNPTKKHLEALAEFFGISPAYFFDEAEASAIADELVLLRSLAGTGATRVAMRLGGLSKASLRDIANVIKRFRASEGLDAIYGEKDSPK